MRALCCIARSVFTGLPIAALIALCSFLSIPLPGQTCKSGELRVLVKDSQESVIFDAQVRVASDKADLPTETTHSMGVADFKNVPCGSWTVHAVKAGFEESTSTIQIKNGSIAEISLVLTPAMHRSRVEVVEKAPAVEQSASENNELRPSEVKALPGNPPTVADTLPLVPGVVRGPQGELKIDGNGEERAALVVNQSDVTDPATGKFGPTLPVDNSSIDLKTKESFRKGRCRVWLRADTSPAEERLRCPA
jgi:hypothetical protein